MSIIGGLLTGLGGLSSILGGLGIGGKNVPMENANPYTDEMMKMFQSQLGASDQMFGNYASQAGGSASRMGGVESALQRLARDMGNITSPGVNAGYNLYESRKGDVLDFAEDAARRFTQPYREEASRTAERRASDAAQNIMSQFGGAGFSGAAQKAASSGAADVLSDYETNMAGMFGNMGANLAGQALGQERGLAEAAPQQRFANIINNLLQQAQLQQSRGSVLANQGSLYGNIANQYGSRSQNLLGQIGALSAPQYYEPTQTNPLGVIGQGLGGFGSMLSNPDFLNLFSKTKAPSVPQYSIPYETNSYDYNRNQGFSG
jgi:hypothetical protein